MGLYDNFKSSCKDCGPIDENYHRNLCKQCESRVKAIIKSVWNLPD